MLNLDKLMTEKRNPFTMDIDKVSTLEMCLLINEEDKRAAVAVRNILPQIARAVDEIAARLADGGRLFYVGAGTSGRLGILDAVECPPTYGTDPEMVQGIIAGGYPAIFKAQEGAEDSPDSAAEDLKQKNLTEKDCVIGIAASGRTPYVIGALRYATSVNALTAAVSCSPDSPIEKEAQYSICALTGPEAVTGSTRMKAGTAQKMILNMISTCTMIKLGKVYGNLMVDVKASNEKLRERAKKIVMEAADCSYEKAADALERAGGKAKTAILMLLTGKDSADAEELLLQSRGFIAEALKKRQE